MDNCLIETASKTLIAGCKNSIIPDDGSVISIADYAFSGCTGLTSITIPDSVTSIGNSAFANCISLKTVYYSGTQEQKNEISVGSNNTELTNADWIYATESGDNLTWEYIGLTHTLVISGTGNMKNYTLTRIVAQDYFDDLEEELAVSIPSVPWDGYDIQTIEIQNGVTSIGDYAFLNLSGLTSIRIPESVTSIGKIAFYGCTSLKTVYYSGTESQKDQISIGSNNTYLTNAEWICNCTAERAEKCETLRKVYLKTAIQKKSGAKSTDSSYNLRLISMLDGLNDYSEVGFYITIAGYNDGENDEPIKYSTDTVYTSFLNGGTRVKASDYGAEYFTIVNMTVPNEYYSSNIKIKPYIVFTDGTEFLGNEINTTVSKYIK